MPLKVALIGNPNSGKTTLFNILTGSNQTVGNWPGVTVEKNKAGLSMTGLFLFAIFRVYIHFHHIRQRKS